MLGLPGIFGTIIDLLTVVIGFGLIVFIHELGHFVAARWAGIRVLTFAVGFGPPVYSWRRGVGFRRGSSIEQYKQSLSAQAAGDASFDGKRATHHKVSPTEYRLSALPFGGYVQMLGQDDMDPTAVSNAPDSYQNAPIWKRMIVISAGVVMNVLLAGFLFVIVFMAGLSVQPPIVGAVAPEAPAARMVADNAEMLGIDEPGLMPGDEIIEIGGHHPLRFDSIALKIAMAEAGRPMDLIARRAGIAEPLRFNAIPEKNELTGLLELGVYPPVSTTLQSPKNAETRTLLQNELTRLGLGELKPGDRITAINGQPARTSHDIGSAFELSAGEPISLTVGRGDETLEFEARAQPGMELAELIGEHTGPIIIEHLLGLVPVMRVADGGEAKQGLEPGDVFLRIGSVEFPSFAAGINEVRGHSRRGIELVVLRKNELGEPEIIPIDADVSKKGLVGFTPDDTMRSDTLLALPPAMLRSPEADEPTPSPSASLFARAGARVVSIAGRDVSSFDEIRSALLAETHAARGSADQASIIEIEYTFPFASADSDKIYRSEWTLDEAALGRLDALGWHSPLPPSFFEAEQIILKADGPLDAVRLGVAETHRVMMSVYVTFLRLTQGSLQVEHIKGPIGIAHIGTMIADRGLIWMLFFLGLISVNLAVVNFLPLPIVDGGQFLMLLYEQIRGKPVPIPVQNAVMAAGLLLIVSVFLVVTFNDIRALLGG